MLSFLPLMSHEEEQLADLYLWEAEERQSSIPHKGKAVRGPREQKAGALGRGRSSLVINIFKQNMGRLLLGMPHRDKIWAGAKGPVRGTPWSLYYFFLR